MLSKAAADKFLEVLESEKALEVLQAIAILPPEKFRAAIANPAPFFRKAGLKPPRGVTLAIAQRPLDPKKPSGPGDQPPPQAKPELRCFWMTVEISAPFSEPYVVQKLVCIRVNVGPFGEVTIIGGSLF